MFGPRKMIVVAAAMLIAWLVAAVPLLRAEIKGLGVMPSVAAATPDERARLVLGDAVAIAESVAAEVPTDATVLFLSPRDEGAVGYYSGIVNYRLYPRRVTALGPSGAIDAGKLATYDYILIYRTNEGGSGAREVAQLASRIFPVVPITVVGSWSGQNGFAGLYSVGGEAAQ